MPILGQINVVYDFARIKSLRQAPLYVKELTYDRISQQFEKPHDALANRHHNPVARVYLWFLSYCKAIVKPFSRIEISIRIKPET